MKKALLALTFLTGCSDMWFDDGCIQKIHIKNVVIDPNDKIPDDNHPYITELNLQIFDAEDNSLIHDYNCNNDENWNECRLIMMKVCYEDMDTIWKFHIEQNWICIVDDEISIERGTSDLDFQLVNYTSFYDDEIRCHLLVDK